LAEHSQKPLQWLTTGGLDCFMQEPMWGDFDMTTKTLAGLLCGVALLIAGCNSSEPSSTSTTGSPDNPSTAQKKYKIAVIPKGTSHEFWKAVHAGAEEAAKDLGVEIIWRGPQREDDQDDQIKEVENFTSQGVDGICLAPL